MSKTKVAVLGAGAWGTAIACMLVRNGHDTVLWARDEAHVKRINDTRRNKAYLDDLELPESLSVDNDLSAVVGDASNVFLVTPAQSITHMASLLGDRMNSGVSLVLCAKGIDRRSGKTPAQIVASCVNQKDIAVLSGPSFARDVMQSKPTAVTLAAYDLERAKLLAQKFSGKNFRIYASDDVEGVELGGALKNVLALCVGAVRGMELGASAEAALIARGFVEMRRLAQVMGAKPDTLTGLSGLGDLVLTASSSQSRNFSYGVALGQGKSTHGLPLAEGAFTASIASELARENGVDVPIIASIGAVLENRITVHDAVRSLMGRPLRAE